MRGDYAALLGPTGVASHAMGKKKRPTNHDAANLRTAGKKIDVKPHKQYNIKNQDMDSSHVPDINQEKDKGMAHHQERGLGGLTSDPTVSDPACDACCTSATPPGYHGGRKWPVAIRAPGSRGTSPATGAYD